MIDRWETRFNRIRLFGWLALAGVPLIAISAFTKDFVQVSAGVAGALLIAPAFIYIYVVVILHWKDRYRGKHSDLWGVLILVETTGWMKLIYLFRHIIPDMRHTGRYQVVFRPEVSVP
jgi:hypothetical protein